MGTTFTQVATLVADTDEEHADNRVSFDARYGPGSAAEGALGYTVDDSTRTITLTRVTQNYGGQV